MILNYSILIFVTQLIFIGCRTWNVRAIAKNNLKEVLISGSIVYISWLISLAIGSVSMYEIIDNFKWEFIPVILAGLFGGLVGTYFGLIEKKIKK